MREVGQTKGINNAGESLRHDAEFCANVIRDGPGRLPASFIKMAIGCLTLHDAPVADTRAVIRSHLVPIRGSTWLLKVTHRKPCRFPSQ